MSAVTQRAGWSRLPLRAAAFVALTCVAILGVSGWREWAARDAVLKGAEAEMANVARSLTQHAEDSLDLLDSGVVGVVSRLEMDGAEPATIAKLRTLLEARKKAIERIHSLAIIDDRGNWLTSPGTIGSTLNDDAFFRYHQLSPKREPHVGRPVKSLLDGEWVVTLSRRFNKLDGSFGGVVLATISSGYLSHFYEQFEIGRNSSVALTHGDGRIIALTSDHTVGNLPYGASKGALDRITLAAAHELGHLGVSANVINPGPVDTGWMNDPIRDSGIRRTPLNRLGTPHDTANLVDFLCSPEGQWINGQLLFSNGGFA
jgi:NAD(P)-dependent dehydrogenase (short-subunit alcohol dehydrogenase family)